VAVLPLTAFLSELAILYEEDEASRLIIDTPKSNSRRNIN